MSAPTNEETMPTACDVINKEGSVITEPEKQQENNSDNNNGQVIGDIGAGNPPRENNNIKLHAEEPEDKETDKGVIQPPPSTTIIDENIEEEELEAMRINSPTPIKDNSGDDYLDEEPYPKRPSVFSGREHEETDDFLLSTMLAIRTAVLAGTKDATNVDATPEDFAATRKHKISMAGDRKVEVKDYAPVVFTLLRRKFGISIPAYLLSWSDSRIAKSRSAGKSDSLFIHSPDNKFILKTLVSSEAKRLCKILPQYYIHLITHKDTFLSRIYGLHRMSRRRGQSNVYFAIFNNVFDTGQPLNEIYDLKGSTVGRRAAVTEAVPQRRSSTSFEFKQVRRMTAGEGEQVQPKKPTVLKDLDFTRQLHLGPDNKAKVLSQLAIDCKFLSQHLLMDYSLLIGIRRTDSVSASDNLTDSPHALSRSIATPGSSPDLRVPGLLFFLESTKAASSKSIKETKRDRRKSITPLGGKSLLTPNEDLNAIDEEKAEGEDGETEGGAIKQSTPPLSTPISAAAHDALEDSTGTTPPIVDGLKDKTKKDIEDEEDVPAPTIKATSSPIPQRKNQPHQGNSGEVGTQPIPILKFSFTSPTSPPPSSPPTSSTPATTTSTTVDTNGHNEVNGSMDDSEDSTAESDSDSPRAPLGLVTVNSVPNFSYFGTNNQSSPSIPRTGSGLSVNNTPLAVKRPGRSASLNYVNLDPLCEPPFVPFHKAEEGGLKGNTFLGLDPKKSNEIYFIGVIDFLQKYNRKKKLAGFAKSFKYEKEELSTVDPVFYMERFLKMAEKAVTE